MPAFNIAVVDEGGSLSPGDDAVAAFAAALQVYNDDWLAAFWPEVRGTTVMVAQPGKIPPGAVPLVLAPTTTMANSAGYHNDPDGQPVGIVELDAVQRYGMDWTVAASHEFGELLINPKLDQFVQVGDAWYPKEIADPVTSDSFAVNAFAASGVMMSNFATPAFWNPAAPAGSRFDAMALATAPLPTIPHRGWLEWSTGGQPYQSAYGPDIAPDMIAYMNAKEGRRRLLRARREQGLWG